MSFGSQFLAAILTSGKTSEYVSYGDIHHMFRPNELPFATFVRDFVKKHSKLPKLETVELHVGDEFPSATEPADHYFSLLENRYTEQELKKSMKLASEKLGVVKKDAPAALELLKETVMRLSQQGFRGQVLDFRQASSVLIPAYVKEYQQEESERLFFGWPYVDDLSGGMEVGDLISIVGRPQQGKTWFLLWASLFGWQDKTIIKNKKEVTISGQSRMFVSMEMKPTPIMQRLAAIQTSVPYGALDKAALSNTHFKQFKDGLTVIEGFGAPYYVIDGNLAATVEDIWLLARQLNPGSIWIDGGYLVQHPTERDRYKRVAENSNLMKKTLADIAPTVVSWQFAKPSSKQKKGESQTMDDIGYSDAIAQDSSLALGVMQKDSVETMNQRLIDLLKGRKGETGQFGVKWDFAGMDFGQIEEQDVEDLAFV